MMTVGQLKAALEAYGEHLPVIIAGAEHEFDIFSIDSGAVHIVGHDQEGMVAVKLVTDEDPVGV